ncbi:MAG: DUF3883 domain-containing protein [Desulfobacterales bacterium]|nr:DUF3883 domain-containing protein [Desulfobacterales bacterium]
MIDLKQGVTIEAPFIPEPSMVILFHQIGISYKLIAKGERTGAFFDITISQEQIDTITIIEENSFKGDAKKAKLAIEALRLGLAYEYDPYFTLSISRIDPLPHQLEAVYDYFLRTPQIRFLLADDPGAGKTIMAGLLIKELKTRGLIKRILIITPANLTFQWQRELKDKFRETFEIIRGDILRANYGINPWQEKNQVITSVSWVSIIEDAKESLLRSDWDLIIVDEAHKMSASDDEHKTYAYRLGEVLFERTDHLLLMTATPHKGDPEHFRLFLQLLDKDIYADISSLEEAVRNRSAPFYLRRVKEALVSFPDTETGKAKSLFTKRNVKTVDFQIADDEWDFYNELTRFVEDMSAKVAGDNSPQARAVGFTMAMLQRRFASSLYAAKRSLERMKLKREEILRDPESYRRKRIEARLPEDFDDLPDDEQAKIIEDIESSIVSINPLELKKEIDRLEILIDKANELQKKSIETKLNRLKMLLEENGIFRDVKTKVLLFTEHKDTLDYLSGDGQHNRPVGKLLEWGLSVTSIYGGMKPGDRNTHGTRIHAENDFRENKQILVATEAAGEGINLQFCWLMINYDIPWNPIRLEQRMGRIHRYGQEKDCLILNFVAINTREGRVMQKLFERIKRIEDDIDPDRTGKVFNVLGDILPSNLIEKMIREMYARNLSEDVIKDRIIEEIDVDRIGKIISSTLEGLARRELNLSAIVGKTIEAKESRLVPEVIRDFFLNASTYWGLYPKRISPDKSDLFHVGKVPRNIWQRGVTLEPYFGVLAREYKSICFDKNTLKKDGTLEWVTPGHPLFESVREETYEAFVREIKKGVIYYDVYRNYPSRLNIFTASIIDGAGQLLHKRIFVIESMIDGTLQLRQPKIFLDIIAADNNAKTPDIANLPTDHELESFLVNNALSAYKNEIESDRKKELDTIEKHLELSLTALIHRQNIKMGEMIEAKENNRAWQGIEGQISQIENRILELNNRLDFRRKKLIKERQIAITDIRHLGSAWVLPHPEIEQSFIKAMLSDHEIENIAINAVIKHEESQFRKVQSVEKDNRGFDLISRAYHPEDTQTAIDVRFIEVKGRAQIGEIALTENEYKTACRMGKDYFLYVVYNCITNPEILIIQDPATLGWQSVKRIEHYRIKAEEIIKNSSRGDFCKS